MGANAQTTVPTFTASQVLTADQQNQSARTGVPVFATTGTRDAAFGGTGEKTLAEGQLCYLEGTGLQTYNGTSWVTWGAAPSSGALVYLTGASFTTVTSFSLPASTFTSTYRNYKIMWEITAMTADADFTCRMRASGSDNTTANYDNCMQGITNVGFANNVTNAAQTSWNMGEQDSSIVWYSAVFDIVAPQATENTFLHGQYGFINKTAESFIQRTGIQVFRDTTSFDSLSVISSVASSMTGLYRVYAYTNS